MKNEMKEAVEKVIVDNSVLVDREGISNLYASVLKIAGFGLGGILYTAGKKAGARGAILLKDHLKIEGRDLIEAMVCAFETGKWGKMEIEECEGEECKVKVTENALVKGLEEKKKPVCHPLAGYIAGFFEVASGGKVQVKEEACMGKGDPACIFHVKVG